MYVSKTAAYQLVASEPGSTPGSGPVASLDSSPRSNGSVDDIDASAGSSVALTGSGDAAAVASVAAGKPKPLSEVMAAAHRERAKLFVTRTAPNLPGAGTLHEGMFDSTGEGAQADSLGSEDSNSAGGSDSAAVALTPAERRFLQVRAYCAYICWGVCVDCPVVCAFIRPLSLVTWRRYAIYLASVTSRSDD